MIAIEKDTKIEMGKRHRERERERERERLIIWNWLIQIWGLTCPKTCRVV